MTKGDKTILRDGAIVLILGAGLVIAYALLYGDAPPPDDADLQVVREEVPDDQNAFALFKQAADKADLSEEAQNELRECQESENPDPAKVEDLLKRNGEALALWHQGLARPVLQVPPAAGILSTSDFLSPWLNLARVADLGAKAFHRQGKDTEAFEEALRIVRFGRMVKNAKGDLITFLVGSQVEQEGLARLRRMTPGASLDAGQLTRFNKELAPGRPSGAALADALRGEYQNYVRAVDALHRGGPLDFSGSTPPDPQQPRSPPAPDFLLQANRTKAFFAEVMRAYVENASKPCAEAVWPDNAPPEEAMELTVSPRMAFAKGNGIGKMLLNALWPKFKAAIEGNCQGNAALGATRLLLALKAYKMDKGRLPERLDDLVPAYLESVPLDDFDGRPLRYSAAKKVVYSIGKDLVDDGGQGALFDEIKEEPSPEDKYLVFRVPE